MCVGMLKEGLFVSAFYFTCVSAVFGHISAPPRVTLLHGGTLRGAHINTVRGRIVDAFLGIPYAEPPKGPLRFTDPRPKIWTGDRDARTKSEPCPQFDITGSSAVPFGNEDCLYLNVYTPRDRQKDTILPVMVWVHGGAFQMESSDPSIYGPERLLDHDIVLVTFNYRIGALGFLSTGTEDSPGNYGLKDQNLVLRWIQDNIRVFGGDPTRVTIFGQNAGAASISLHMVSPASKGLFNKAILQSGNLFDPWAITSKEKAAGRAEEMAKSVGCHSGHFGEMMRCMRNVPAARIVWAQQKLFAYRNDPVVVLGPVIEPRTGTPFLADNPRDVFDAHGIEIPIIIGANSDEGAVKSAPIINQYSSEFRRNFDSLLPQMLFYEDRPRVAQAQITDKIENYYFKNGLSWTGRRFQNLTNMFTDRLFFAGMDRFLRHRLSAPRKYVGNTYVYIFNHNGPRSATHQFGGGYYGVAHFDELPFLFPYGQLGTESEKRDRQMYWALPQMWADFARTGDPTPTETLVREKWKRATKYPLSYAKIGSEYFGNQNSLIPELYPLNQISPVRKRKVKRKNTLHNYPLQKNFHGGLSTTEERQKFSHIDRLHEHRNFDDKELGQVIDDFDAEDYPEIIGGIERAYENTTENAKHDILGETYKKHRVGKSHHCHSRRIYCKILHNMHGDFWQSEAAYIYY